MAQNARDKELERSMQRLGIECSVQKEKIQELSAEKVQLQGKITKWKMTYKKDVDSKDRELKELTDEVAQLRKVNTEALEA